MHNSSNIFNRIAIPSHVFVMIQIEFRFRMIARCGVCEQNTVKKKKKTCGKAARATQIQHVPLS